MQRKKSSRAPLTPQLAVGQDEVPPSRGRVSHHELEGRTHSSQRRHLNGVISGVISGISNNDTVVDDTIVDGILILKLSSIIHLSAKVAPEGSRGLVLVTNTVGFIGIIGVPEDDC